jgi:hypothetical protein
MTGLAWQTSFRRTAPDDSTLDARSQMTRWLSNEELPLLHPMEHNGQK